MVICLFLDDTFSLRPTGNRSRKKTMGEQRARCFLLTDQQVAGSYGEETTAELSAHRSVEKKPGAIGRPYQNILLTFLNYLIFYQFKTISMNLYN